MERSAIRSRRRTDLTAEQPRGPRVIVRRALPTDPATRGSASLFLTEADRQGIAAERRLLFVGLEPAGQQVAVSLRVAPGTAVIARRKLLLAAGVPVRVATSFLRADLFGGTRLVEPGFVEPSLQAAIGALGHRFGVAEETLTCRPPSPTEAGTLALGPGEWVVQILRASRSTEGLPIHTLETVCAASRHVFPIAQAPGDDQF